MEMLLERGANVNSADDKGFTALHFAAAANAVKPTQMLIDRGADVNAATEKGHTPIFTAAEQHNTAVALILMDNGADMTLEDENENGPVDLCSGRAATRQYTGEAAHNNARQGRTLPRRAQEAAEGGVVSYPQKEVGALTASALAGAQQARSRQSAHTRSAIKKQHKGKRSPLLPGASEDAPQAVRVCVRVWKARGQARARLLQLSSTFHITYSFLSPINALA